MFKKSVAVVSALLLSVVGLVAIATPAQAANIVLDMSGKSIRFNQSTQTVTTYSSGRPTIGFANDTSKYSSVATVNGITIDGVITVTKTAGTSITLDAASSAVTAPPAGSTTPIVGDLLQSDVTPGASNGYAELNFKFYEAGTYTGPGTGNQVTLTNLTVNTYDLDYVNSGHQFTMFQSFQTYSLSASPSASTITVSNDTGGWVKFLDAGTGNYGDNNGSYTKGRAMVTYNQLTELSVRHGVHIATGGKFALDFGPGYPWKDSTVQPTTTNNNPNNSAPTSAAKTINYSSGTPWVFSLESVPSTQIASPNNYFDFPYADAENNAFASVQIVTLPGAGTLELLVGSTWTAVTAGQVIPVTSINLKKLRYTGTTNTSFTFKVYDGQAYSATAYTMTMNVATNAQTITFNNPGTKPVSATPFASGATASSGLTVTLTSSTPSVCTVTGVTITAVATGVCTIVATQSGGTNGGQTYSAAPPVTQTFNVSSLRNQVITLNNPGTQTISTNIGTAPAATSTLPVSLVSLTTDVCTVTYFTVYHIAEGYCTLYATQSGDATWAPAAPVQVTYLVNAGSMGTQTITFTQPANITTGTSSVTLSASASSGLNISFLSNTPSVCSVNSAGVVTILTSGACTITASQNGNGTSIAPATPVVRTFYILEVTTTSLPSGVAGTAYSSSVAAYGGATGSYAWQFAAISCLSGSGLSLNGSTGAITGANPVAGTYVCDYMAIDSGVTATKQLTIVIAASAPPAKTTNTITWAQLPNVSITNGNITLGATSTGSAASPATLIYYTSNTPTVCTVTGNVVTILTSGYCELTADDDGNSSYAAAAQATNSFNIFEICTPSISSGFENQPYTQSFQTLGTVGAGTFSLTGALPTGLSLDPNSGVLSGNPSQPWNGSITITYTQGGSTHSRTYSLVINAAPGTPPPGGGSGGGGSTPSTPTPTPTPSPTTPGTPSPTPTPTPSEPAQVELKAVVNFAGDSTKFVGNSAQIIRNLASNIIAEEPTAVVIKVDGYVNKTGVTSYDTKLALARAKATAKALLAQGVEATVVTTVSKGIHTTTGTSARRAEVTVIVKK